MTSIPKPNEGEYAPYTMAYIRLLPDDGQVLTHLQNNRRRFKDLLTSFSDEQLSTPHEPGEWTMKEILIHVIDTERVFAYRALRLARNDSTALPGFEQDDYVAAAGANKRSIDDLLEEYTAVRQATLTLLNSFDDAVWTRAGVASGFPLTVRAATYQIAGHEMHHIDSIKENYL